MAESIAIDAAKGLAQLIAARALDEIYLVWGFKDELLKLNRKFEYIQAFFEDAGNSKHAQKSQLVNLWLQKIKDVAYLADNVKDEYAIEIFRKKVVLKNRFTLSDPVFFRSKMAHKVKDILALFDEINKDAREIGLNPVDIAAKALTDTYDFDDRLRETRQHASAYASEFVGREGDHETLHNVICSPANEGHGHGLSTLAVVGMGGLGKTRFVRRVYDDEKIGAHFGNNKIWITVSHKFDITKLLNEMVEAVTSSKLELSNTDAIIRKLQEELKGKKVLVVFDDVWNDDEDSWSSFKGLLLRIGTVQGSVLLITTRNGEVAKAAGAVFEHKLKGLSDGESRRLLEQIVFSNSSSSSRTNYSGLEGVEKKIIKKCGGVPLAFKVIRGLLSSTKNLYDWEQIEKSELWNLQLGQNKILPWLLLSFNHLPSPSVKQCFAYYAVIPKGCSVYKDELIGLWSSQGYLHNDKGKNLSMEEIGERYLKILLSNSLLEQHKRTELGITSYKMHDLVYDLAVYVCGSELVKEAKDLSEEGGCRHLLINSEQDKITSDFPSEKALKNLRTLDLKGSVIPWNMLSHTKYLRTLSLDRTGMKELPPAVALLKHLRFLDVSYNPISTLPDSISKLYQLQTLILQSCINMKKLPKVVNKLMNLRHISTNTPMFACKGLQQLTSLQSLPSLSLDDDVEGWSIDELGDLHDLRDGINILGLECVKDKEQARNAGLGRKARVTNLNLSWATRTGETSGGVCDEDEDVLEGLEPHHNIKSLQVHNFNGVRFPRWIKGMDVLTEGSMGNRTRLNNLTTVKLLNCSRCQTLPSLGQLPFLECLILSGLDVEVIGIEFYGVDDFNTQTMVSFKCLRELEISEFHKLSTWMMPPVEAFPHLKTLRLRGCWELESVAYLGITSLISLELKDLYKAKSLNIIPYNRGLTSLIMDTFPAIVSLPDAIVLCEKLQILHISKFKHMPFLPCGLRFLKNLQSLRMEACPAFRYFPDDLLDANGSLRVFQMIHCPKFKKFPRNLEECTSLEKLWIIMCPKVEVSPINISKLRRLSELRITCNSAEYLRSVLQSGEYLPLLRILFIEGFRNEEDIRDYFSDITPFLRLPSLTELMLCGRPNIKTLPQQLGLFTQISALYIWGFKDLEEISSLILNLSSLDRLILVDCRNLKGLPSKENLRRLTYLKINYCPLLAERYNKDGGSEWHSISHISEISINGKTIQRLDR